MSRITIDYRDVRLVSPVSPEIIDVIYSDSGLTHYDIQGLKCKLFSGRLLEELKKLVYNAHISSNLKFMDYFNVVTLDVRVYLSKPEAGGKSNSIIAKEFLIYVPLSETKYLTIDAKKIARDLTELAKTRIND